MLGSNDALAAALRAGAGGAAAGDDGKVQPLPDAKDWDDEDISVDDMTEDEESGGAGDAAAAAPAAADSAARGGGGGAGTDEFVAPAHMTPEGAAGSAGPGGMRDAAERRSPWQPAGQQLPRTARTGSRGVRARRSQAAPHASRRPPNNTQRPSASGGARRRRRWAWGTSTWQTLPGRRT
jgi:hypothetical protein